MKTVELEHADLEECIADARAGQVVVMRDGLPVALVVSLQDLDDEARETASDPEFWKMIDERRRQPTMTRDELERRLDERDRPDERL